MGEKRFTQCWWLQFLVCHVGGTQDTRPTVAFVSHTLSKLQKGNRRWSHATGWICVMPYWQHWSRIWLSCPKLSQVDYWCICFCTTPRRLFHHWDWVSTREANCSHRCDTSGNCGRASSSQRCCISQAYCSPFQEVPGHDRGIIISDDHYAISQIWLGSDLCRKKINIIFRTADDDNAYR